MYSSNPDYCFVFLNIYFIAQQFVLLVMILNQLKKKEQHLRGEMLWRRHLGDTVVQ